MRALSGMLRIQSGRIRRASDAISSDMDCASVGRRCRGPFASADMIRSRASVFGRFKTSTRVLGGTTTRKDCDFISASNDGATISSPIEDQRFVSKMMRVINSSQLASLHRSSQSLT